METQDFQNNSCKKISRKNAYRNDAENTAYEFDEYQDHSEKDEDHMHC